MTSEHLKPMRTHGFYDVVSDNAGEGGEAQTENLRSRFMLAAINPLSKLWSIREVVASGVGTDNPSYDFSGLIKENMEALDVLQRLHNFEENMYRQGALRSYDGKLFPTGVHYHDQMGRLGILQDEVEGNFVALEQPYIPTQQGHFSQKGLEAATQGFTQMARMADDASLSPLDQMLNIYGGGDVDWQALCATVNVATATKQYVDALSACHDTCQRIIRDQSLNSEDVYSLLYRIRVSEEFDVYEKKSSNTYNRYDKTFAKALAAAKKSLGEMKPSLSPQDHKNLQDNIDLCDVYFRILLIQLELKKTLKAKGTLSPAAIKRRVDKIKKRHLLSVESQSHIDRACLDIHNMRVPEAVTNMINDINNASEKSAVIVKLHMQDVSRRNAKSENLSHRMLRFKR